MKNLFKSIAAIAIVATLFTSCSKDEDKKTEEVGAPSITLTAPASTNLTLRFNDIVGLSFKATPASGAKLKSILITRKNNTSEVTRSIYGDSTAKIADSSSITRTVNDSILNSIANVNDKLIYTLTITDDKGKSTSKTITVTVLDLYVSGQFIIGANANTTIEEKFIGFDANSPKTITMFKAGINTTGGASTADSATRGRFNSSKVDMLFYFGTSNLSTICSPTFVFNSGEIWDNELKFWGTKNSTIFIKPTISPSQYAAENYIVEPLIDQLDFSGGSDMAKLLVDGTVIGFKTANGSKGLLLLEKGAVDNKSYFTASVKWKK